MTDAIKRMAAIAAAAGIRQVSLSVDDAATEAIASMPGATSDLVVYVRPRASTVIRRASVVLGGVRVEAQSESRPATQAEIDGAAGWHDHCASPYQSGLVAQ